MHVCDVLEGYLLLVERDHVEHIIESMHVATKTVITPLLGCEGANATFGLSEASFTPT